MNADGEALSEEINFSWADSVELGINDNEREIQMNLSSKSHYFERIQLR